MITMKKSTTYTVKVTVTKSPGMIPGMNKYDVKAEGSGFVGESEDGFSLGSTFEKAYEDLMAKVSEAIFANDK